MGTARSKLDSYIETYLRPRFPELVDPLIAALDSYDEIIERDQVSKENLQNLVVALSSNRIPLYETVSGYVSRLSGQWQEVCAAILELSRSPKAHIRFNAILCLGNETPSDVVDVVLRNGLRDRSSRVRKKAADWVVRLLNRRLIPDVSAALTVETHKEVRSGMDLTLRLLRDGHILEKMDDGSLWITVLTDGGGFCSEAVEASQFESEGIKATIRRLQSG